MTQYIGVWQICQIMCVNVTSHILAPPLLTLFGRSELRKWNRPGNPPLLLPLWNSISQGPRVVSLSAISSAALTLSSAASRSFFLSLCLCFHPPQHTPLLPPSLPLFHPIHPCAQGSSEACSWPRPPLLWAKASAGGQGSGSSLKKSRQIKDKKYWGRKK